MMNITHAYAIVLPRLRSPNPYFRAVGSWNAFVQGHSAQSDRRLPGLAALVWLTGETRWQRVPRGGGRPAFRFGNPVDANARAFEGLRQRQQEPDEIPHDDPPTVLTLQRRSGVESVRQTLQTLSARRRFD